MRTTSGEQLMAHLGLPLKHRLPRQGWRKEKLLLAHIHHNAHIETLGNGKKMRSLCSTLLLWGVSTSSGFLEMGAISGEFSFQVLEHSSPESQPVVFVDQQVTSLIYHNVLHVIFSCCSQFPWFTSHGSHSLHENKSSMPAPFLCFLFPLLVMYKETAKNKYQVRIYYFNIQFLTKAETRASYANYLIPWNVLGTVLEKTDHMQLRKY